MLKECSLKHETHPQNTAREQPKTSMCTSHQRKQLTDKPVTRWSHQMPSGES